ncbi:uncharacterized protein LOC122498946 isoform X2 [Leptopilina heterotoma]|uniref:uncharacterized protein LOC122498946 isoform X2 n=1 Tax=Leptopilina heterotoma TaxID=63436 RepID=UPI001CA9DA85|nr:uncharacterized protein LOC122498946 isoform X2 [Leptopilina heterotoma]
MLVYELARWVFLIAGIYHGIVKHKEYSIEAAIFREEEKQRILLKKEEFAREENLRNQETARELAEALTGLRVRFEKVFPSENSDDSIAETESKLIKKPEIENTSQDK